MNSSSHRTNIVNPNFTKLGVGYDYDAAGESERYWTQLFVDSLKASETLNVSNATLDVNVVTKAVTLSDDAETYANVDYGVTIDALGGD